MKFIVQNGKLEDLEQPVLDNLVSRQPSVLNVKLLPQQVSFEYIKIILCNNLH